MIWFSAESALISTSPSACGPIAIPAMRNTTTSGILIFWASRAATVPIARIRPHESSVCFAISRDADASMAVSCEAKLSTMQLIQRLQPVADFAGRDIGLLQQFSHGEEAVELAWKSPVRHRHAGFLQAFCIFVAFVAQGIGAGGQHIGGRQSREALDARGGGPPVVAVGGAVQVVIA